MIIELEALRYQYLNLLKEIDRKLQSKYSKSKNTFYWRLCTFQ